MSTGFNALNDVSVTGLVNIEADSVASGIIIASEIIVDGVNITDLLDDLENQIDTNATNIAQLQTDVATLQTDVDYLQNNVGYVNANNVWTATNEFTNTAFLNTNYGSSANIPFYVRDSISNQSFNVVPNSGPGSYNPNNGTGECVIFTKSNAVNNGVLNVSTWSQTNTGLKIMPTSIRLGAGGYQQPTPTSYILCDSVGIIATAPTFLFNTGSLPTCTGPIPSPSDNSTKIPTTQWVQNAISLAGTGTLSSNNIWTGTNQFSSTLTSTGTLPNPGDSSSQVATTQWVRNAILPSPFLTTLEMAANYAVTFQDKSNNNTNYKSVALSSVGNLILAVDKTLNRVILATDYGAANFFSVLLSGGPFWNVAMSSIGKHMIAISGDPINFTPGLIYFSSDYGLSFTTPLPQRNYTSAAISSDGRHIAITVFDGHIYVSNDYGTNFSQKWSQQDYVEIAMSSTGQYMVALDYGGYFFTSNDYGNTWSTNMSLGIQFFKGVSISATGQIQVICVENGYLYISYYYGQYWEQIHTSQPYASVRNNSTGQFIVAITTTGVLHYSQDFGKTFATRQNLPIRPSSSVAISASGITIAIGTTNSYLMVSRNSVY